MVTRPSERMLGDQLLHHRDLGIEEFDMAPTVLPFDGSTLSS